MPSGILPHKIPAVAGTQITLSTAGASLKSLMRTALSDPTYEFTDDNNASPNAVNIQAEDGDIRFLQDGNVPTTALGQIVPVGTLDTSVRGANLEDVWLVAVAGTPKVNITIGETTRF